MAEAKFLAARRFRAARLGITPEELARLQDESLAGTRVDRRNCVDDEDLAMIAEGAEPDAEQAAHLETCRECRGILEEIKASDSLN
jgi:hypothetical protein